MTVLGLSANGISLLELAKKRGEKREVPAILRPAMTVEVPPLRGGRRVREIVYTQIDRAVFRPISRKPGLRLALPLSFPADFYYLSAHSS
jgi:hypothetical protein